MAKLAYQNEPQIIKVDRKGFRLLVFFCPFSGDDTTGRHYFNDHGHSIGFVKYLFSQSGKHQPNKETFKNAICHFKDDKIERIVLNDNPRGWMHQFLRTAHPKTDGDELLCDDGCYIAFIMQFPSGVVVSNYIEQTGQGDDRSIEIDVGKMDFMEDFDVMGETQAFIHAAKTLPDIQDFETIQDLDLLLRVERFLHQAVNRHMGLGALITVSHRDQPDHNPHYHIHRLIRRAAA